MLHILLVSVYILPRKSVGPMTRITFEKGTILYLYYFFSLVTGDGANGNYVLLKHICNIWGINKHLVYTNIKKNFPLEYINTGTNAIAV